MSCSWILLYDSSPHGTSWSHGERSICVETDFKIVRTSDKIFELCGSKKCMTNWLNATKSAFTMQENTSKR